MVASESTYSLLRQAMAVSNQRASLISSNIANVNTANYKAKQIVFESQLADATQGLALNRTHKAHMGYLGASQGAYVTASNTGTVKENGNNVDLDSEMVSQAMNTIYYEALEKQISGRLSMRNYVINN